MIFFRRLMLRIGNSLVPGVLTIMVRSLAMRVMMPTGRAEPRLLREGFC